MEPVYVPRDPHEKAMQRALMQYRNPKNYQLVYEALVKAGREDLIGFGPNCLIRPGKGSKAEGGSREPRKPGAGKKSAAPTKGQSKQYSQGKSGKIDKRKQEEKQKRKSKKKR